MIPKHVLTYGDHVKYLALRISGFGHRKLDFGGYFAVSKMCPAARPKNMYSRKSGSTEIRSSVSRPCLSEGGGFGLRKHMREMYAPSERAPIRPALLFSID